MLTSEERERYRRARRTATTVVLGLVLSLGALQVLDGDGRAGGVVEVVAAPLGSVPAPVLAERLAQVDVAERASRRASRPTPTTQPPTTVPPTTVPPTTAAPPPPTTAAPTTTTTTAPPNEDVGEASWYETDPGTCAHRDLPKGTVVTVTNLANGKTATCTVADWGPEKSTGRIIDLEKGVFADLADPSIGVIQVKITW